MKKLSRATLDILLLSAVTIIAVILLVRLVTLAFEHYVITFAVFVLLIRFLLFLKNEQK